MAEDGGDAGLCPPEVPVGVRNLAHKKLENRGEKERERSCLHDDLQDGSPKRVIFTPDLVSLTAVTASVTSLVLLIKPSTLCPRLDIRLVHCLALRA